ncbi:MAG: efflux RND transporter periplasmic adaptor subunit [bacterium]
MKRRTKIFWSLGSIVVVAGVVIALMSSRGNANKNKESTVEVTRGDIVDKALAVGTIEPLVEVSVKSKISGVVKTRFAEVGDFVKAGDPLLEIKPNPTPIELVEAKREVELREIEMRNVDAEIERQKALQERGLVSQQDFESKMRQQEESALQVQISKERLALLEDGRVTIRNANIKTLVESPIDGFVLEKMVEIGDPVTPLSSYQEGTVLMKMADMKDLIFRGTVDEIDVGRLREGMPVEIKIGALPNAQVKGRLAKISLKARKQENSTVFPIEIALTETGGAVLRAGYSANADVIIDRREAVLIVPERVVTFAGDTTRVNVSLPSGDSEERMIKTGLSDAVSIEVTEGLAAGDLVIEKPVKEIK